MSASNGGPAFPFDEQRDGQVWDQSSGITVRDYFAAKAMQAMLTNHKWQVDELSRDAYRAADAMLAERSK